MFVQTGLLASVSVYGNFGTNGYSPVNIISALADADLLETHLIARAEQRKETPQELGALQAIQFVNWATVKTEYEWITTIMGKRSHRPY